MKKLICIILSIILLLSLAACSDQNIDHETAEPSESESTSDNKFSPEESLPTDSDEESLPTGSDEETHPDEETFPNNDNNPGDVENPNIKVNFIECLKTLLSGYKWNPSSVIPEAMLPTYENNLIDASKISIDYSDFTPTNSIPKYGIGEQWDMAIENISQSQIFFTALSVVDNLTTTSITAFNNYIDKNPADTAHHQFESGIYSVTIHCTRKTIFYVLEYTTDLPVLGEQDIQIALWMDTNTEIKHVRVQIGDANALAYTVNENHYIFAIKYMGVRRACFEITENDDGSITGHIYEYITVADLEVVGSICDFYVTDNYVTVVGNKADGMAGFDGYICELYSKDDGRMIGYEVKETQKVLGVDVTFDTLWFDLTDIDGISSIKYIPKESLKEKDQVYINGSTELWETKTIGILNPSRRFDIELRTQYFYCYDSENEKYVKVKMQIPMFFVQEPVYSDLVSKQQGYIYR